MAPPRSIGSVEVAQHYDVASRLAEGQEAVAQTQTYVSACHRRGYRHPDLTGYDGQLADRYDSEAGLDLRLLDNDCAALAALAEAAEDALRRQRGQLVDLAAVWRGPGAESATEFLRRHCDAGAQLTARLRAAATGCAVLRDELWHLVDAKVTAVVRVDERVGAQRPPWLAAANAVNSGADDEHAADVIDKQVMPYVVNDVGGQWVSAVRSAHDSAEKAYRSALAAADPSPGTIFALPGDFGPAPQFADPVATVAPVAMAPMAVDMPLTDAPTAPVPASGAASPAPATPLDDTPADGGVPPESSVPDGFGQPDGLGVPGGLSLPSGGLPGSGLGGLGGLGGLIPRLADAFGDAGSGQPFDEDAWTADDPADDPAGDPADDPDDPDDIGDSEDPEAGPDDSADAENPEQTELVDETGEAAALEPVAAATEPAAEPAAEIAGPAPATEPPAEVTNKTPCEIAAEELPQVGQ